MNRLDRFFDISARGSTIAAEMRGGVVTSIAMAYIIVLNPIILSGGADVAGNKLDFSQVSAVTSLNRRRVHLMGHRAHRRGQGPRGQPAAVGGGGGIPAVLRPRLDRHIDRGMTPGS